LILDHREDIRSQEVEAEKRALHSTLLVSAELDQVFKGFEILMRSAGQTPALRQFNDPECSEYLSRLARVNANSGSIGVVDGAGRIRCGESGIVVADREYFREALEKDGMVVGTYSTGRMTGEPILPLALRFPATEGWGVVVAGLKIEWLREHFAQRFKQFPENASLTIVDRNGIMVVRLPNRDREGQALLNYRDVVTAEAPGTFRSAAERNADGIARFLGYAPLTSTPHGVAVAVGLPQRPLLSEIDASARRNYMLLGAAALVAFLAAGLGGRLFIQRPVAELLDVIDRWRHRDTSARVPYHSEKTEFGRLGGEFNRMADEIEAAMLHKDVLLRELNHRIMNSLQTIAALMRLQSRSIREPEALHQIEQAIARIQTIALAYRRMQAVRGVETIEFAPFLKELCGDLQSSVMSPGVSCLVYADDVSLPHDQAISMSLVANELLTNAIKHGVPEGPIKVTLDKRAEQCRLAVRSRGIVPPDFSPTQTGGFGMRMVSSVAAQMHGEVAVHGEAGEVEFSITFRPDVRPETGHASPSTPPPLFTKREAPSGSGEPA
jgi:two-component sensor histidine kinase